MTGKSGSNGPKFQRGTRVRVNLECTLGHIRTPAYIQGKTGLVNRVHGSYLNPESLAYGGTGLPSKNLYMIEFDQAEVWADYRGEIGDKLYADIFEHWLSVGLT